PELDFRTRSRLLVAQVAADLDSLGLELSGPVRPSRTFGPTAAATAGSHAELDAIELPAIMPADRRSVEVAATALHRPILLRLTVKDAELGKAYALGVGLGQTVLQAYAEVVAGPSGTLEEVKRCVARGFTQ